MLKYRLEFLVVSLYHAVLQGSFSLHVLDTWISLGFQKHLYYHALRAILGCQVESGVSSIVLQVGVTMLSA